MLSEHYDQIWYTRAEFTEYIHYLKGQVGASSRSFLTLKCTGPFEIFNRVSMDCLGRFNLGLTVEESQGYWGN